MDSNKSLRLTDYFSILLKWKKLFIINLLTVTIIAVGISLLIPKKYKASTQIVLSSSGSGGMGGLNSFFEGNSFLSMGAKLLGMGGTSEDVILGLLGSRTILTQVINKYNLMEYYDITDNNFDRVIKSFSGDLGFDINEHGFIEVNVINKDPEKSAELANEFVRLADSLNVSINRENARRQRIFLEKRYHQNLADLKTAEENMKKFQETSGMYSVPEQIKVIVSAAGQLEAEMLEQQVVLEGLSKNVSKNSPLYKFTLNKISSIKEKLKQLNNNQNGTLLKPLKNLPVMQMDYVRLYREVEIQNTILKFIYPMYEQTRIEENKTVQSLVVIDKAVPPQLKDSPKRAFIVLAIFFVFFFMHVLVVLRAEGIKNRGDDLNSFEENENRYYSRLRTMYKVAK